MTLLQANRNIQLAIALESGKYKQGKGVLRSFDEFCCIGVACDLIDPAGWKNRSPSRLLYYDTQTHYAPEPVVDLYGWDSINPLLPCGRAANLNDQGVPFTEIAQGFRLLAALEYEGEPA